MNKKKYKTVTSLLLGVAVLFSAPSVFADNGKRGWKNQDRHFNNQCNKRNIWERQKNQKRRINEGVNSGQLTHQETKKLRRGLHKIRDKTSYFKSDGRFVRQEKRTIHNMLDRSSDRIYRKKHNNVTR